MPSPIFPYAAWAPAAVLKPMKEHPPEALAALQEATQSSDPCVRLLSESALRVLAKEPQASR